MFWHTSARVWHLASFANIFWAFSVGNSMVPIGRSVYPWRIWLVDCSSTSHPGKYFDRDPFKQGSFIPELNMKQTPPLFIFFRFQCHVLDHLLGVRTVGLFDLRNPGVRFQFIPKMYVHFIPNHPGRFRLCCYWKLQQVGNFHNSILFFVLFFWYESSRILNKWERGCILHIASKTAYIVRYWRLHDWISGEGNIL